MSDDASFPIDVRALNEARWNAQCSPCPRCGGDGQHVAVVHRYEGTTASRYVCLECRTQWDEAIPGVLPDADAPAKVLTEPPGA